MKPRAEAYRLVAQRFGVEAPRVLYASAQAWDVELKAGRTKAAHPRSAGLPAPPAEVTRLAPGVFELVIPHHDFALIQVE